MLFIERLLGSTIKLLPFLLGAKGGRSVPTVLVIPPSSPLLAFPFGGGG